MSIGMTFDQYWNDDCRLTEYYRKAYEIQKQRRNQELWLQGAYIYEAIYDLVPVLHAFSKKGAKSTPYPQEPYALSAKEARERKQAEEKRKFEKLRREMIARMNAINKSKTAKQEVTQDG